MSQKVLIIPLEVVIPLQWENLNKVFDVKSSLEFRIRFNLEEFQKGLLTERKLKEELRNIMMQSHLGSLEYFEQIWKRTCKLSKDAHLALAELEALTEQGFRVVLFGDIDPWQQRLIEGDLGRELPGEHYFSHKHKQVGSGLFDLVLAKLREEGVNPQDMAVFYNTPKVREHNWYLDLYRWFWEPLNMIDQIRAEQSLAWIEQKQSREHFMLVNCDRKVGSTSFIAKLSKLGWIQERLSPPFSCFLPMYSSGTSDADLQINAWNEKMQTQATPQLRGLKAR